MSDSVLVRGARAVAAVGVLLSATGLVLAVDTGNLGAWWRAYGALAAVLAGSFGAFAWLAIPRQPRNAAIWSMIGSCALGIEAAGLALVGALSGQTLEATLEPGWVPAQAPTAAAWTLAVAEGAAVVGLFTPLTLGLLLFPDGRLATRRSRVLGLVSGLVIAVLAGSLGWWYRPGNDAGQGFLIDGTLVVLVLAVLGSVLDLGLRFRSSAGITRLQFKWVLWGTTVATVAFGAFALLPDSAARSGLAPVVAMVAGLCWAASYGVAIGRYRLYDIDVILSRTVVYAALAAIVAGTYVMIVVVVGQLAGGSGQLLWLLTTIFVAVLFEPVRARVSRWASHIVYGRDATPYEVLADLALRLALSETADELLARVADRLRAGTGAQRTTAWLAEGDGVRLVAASAADGIADTPSIATPPGTVVPITHDGRLLGQLTMEAAPGGGVRPADVDLAEDLAGSAALVLHKLQLDAVLRARVDEVDESRRRIARAHDDELLRFERELERTLEPPIRALEEGIRRVQGTAVAEGAGLTAAMLAPFGADARDAIDEIRSLSRGIYSPMLDADGLAAAIPALAERTPLDIALELDLQKERYAPAVEGAVYFSVSEALTNAAKYARGPVVVTVSERDGLLAFAIHDSGPGFDVATTPWGSGLHNITDRLDAVGGELTVESQTGCATTLTGQIPLGALLTSVPGEGRRVS